jgi:lysophospholipase L1-like esterase
MKKQFVCSVLFLFFILLVQPAEADKKKIHQPIRILCLGDSITHSVGEYCGYRYSLWKKLVDLKVEFDFIGSMNRRVNEEPGQDCPPYKGKQFDPDHEGHWGWRSDQILGMAAGEIYPDTGSGSLSEWLQHYTPDIVLMHLGHNDAGANETPEQMAGELKEVILLLQKDNPDVNILLAKVIPTAKPLWNSRLSILNAEIDGVAKEMRTSSSEVVVIDFSTGFDPAVDTIDGTHPNESGSEKMAEKWFDGICKFLDQPIPGQAGSKR